MRLLLVALATLVIAGCSPSDDTPWVTFAGGGFAFNYRLAEAYYGFNVRPLRPLPTGTVLEARFEDPAGGPELVVRETVREEKLTYGFRSPPLAGVRKNRPYKVEIRVLAADTGALLGSYGRTYSSEADQDWLPEQPLTVGPGYAPNPEPPPQ
jgi:hypothetical protein